MERDELKKGIWGRRTFGRYTYIGDCSRSIFGTNLVCFPQITLLISRWCESLIDPIVLQYPDTFYHAPFEYPGLVQENLRLTR